MSDLPPSDPGPHWGPPPPPAFGRPARWPTFIAIAIALIGVAVGFVGWFRPAPHNNQPAPKPTYTAQETAEAKAHMCTAFGKVENALHLADARNGSNDPTALLALAEGAWQAFDTGSRYLLTKLAEEPAIPPELATAVRDQANAFQELLINYLDGLHNSDPAMQPAVKASDAATLTIQRLCR
jgi:hypothetical protein